MFTLLNRLIGSKLPPALRIAVYLLLAVVLGFLFHDVIYGVVVGAIGAFATWRQTRKTSFAAAPIVPEQPLAVPPPPPPPVAGAVPSPGPPPPAAPAAPAPPAEGPSIYGS